MIREVPRSGGYARNAIVTGGDSGIGRAVAVHFAREGAKVVVAYLNEEADARATERMVLDEGSECLLFAGDIGDARQCQRLVDAAVERFGTIDILVNNAAEQHPVDRPEALEPDTVERTFRTNIFSFVYLTTAVLPHMPDGSAVINHVGDGSAWTPAVARLLGHQGGDHRLQISLAQAVADRGTA